MLRITSIRSAWLNEDDLEFIDDAHDHLDLDSKFHQVIRRLRQNLTECQEIPCPTCKHIVYPSKRRRGE